MTDNWQPIETLDERVEVLLQDIEGNIRIGERFGPGMFNSSLDFGNYSSSFYWPYDNKPVLWQPLPAAREVL